MVIDPLSVNRQGNDRGVQYRTGIFYTDDSQLPVIRAVFDREQEKAGAPLAVVVEPLKNFFPYNIKDAPDAMRSALRKAAFGRMPGVVDGGGKDFADAFGTRKKRHDIYRTR